MGLDPRTRIAFVDESLSDAMRDPNTHLLGAAVCEQRAVAAVRANIASLRLKRQVKVHWHDEDAKRRMVIAETIARAPVRHLVVVREGRLGERPERQRKKCLERLLYELQELHVATVTFESRGPADNLRDRDAIDGFRARRVISSDLRIEHVPGPREAMLWVSDAVCGATVQHRKGESAYFETLRAGTDIRLIPIRTS